jgi:hypothetical protein
VVPPCNPDTGAETVVELLDVTTEGVAAPMDRPEGIAQLAVEFVVEIQKVGVTFDPGKGTRALSVAEFAVTLVAPVAIAEAAPAI